jgi:hypothetical protein
LTPPLADSALPVAGRVGPASPRACPRAARRALPRRRQVIDERAPPGRVVHPARRFVAERRRALRCEAGAQTDYRPLHTGAPVATFRCAGALRGASAVSGATEPATKADGCGRNTLVQPRAARRPATRCPARSPSRPVCHWRARACLVVVRRGRAVVECQQRQQRLPSSHRPINRHLPLPCTRALSPFADERRIVAGDGRPSADAKRPLGSDAIPSRAVAHRRMCRPWSGRSPRALRRAPTRRGSSSQRCTHFVLPPSHVHQ